MADSRSYFVLANEKFLCSHSGELVRLAEEEFSQKFTQARLVYPVGDASSPVFMAEVEEQLLDGFLWQGLRSQLGLVSEAEFQLAGRALQLRRWHYDHQYCGRCGHLTHAHHQELVRRCVSCELDYYPRLSPCIITLVTRGDECLLAWHQRSKEERYSCLAGFIEAGEKPEQTLVREVMEEVGLLVDNIRYVDSQPWPFPGQLMLGYFADYVAGNIIVDVQEIKAAYWYRYDQLPAALPPASTISGRLIAEFVRQRTSLHG